MRVQRLLPPLNALHTFEAAGRLGSFKAAAAELHVTQGAVSQHVRLLEDWLKVVLFEQYYRRVTLTPAAQLYLSEIHLAFDRVASATSQCGCMVKPQRSLKVNGPASGKGEFAYVRGARIIGR